MVRGEKLYDEHKAGGEAKKRLRNQQKKIHSYYYSYSVIRIRVLYFTTSFTCLGLSSALRAKTAVQPESGHILLQCCYFYCLPP